MGGCHEGNYVGVGRGSVACSLDDTRVCEEEQAGVDVEVEAGCDQ